MRSQNSIACLQCQRAHWKVGHKGMCNSIRNMNDIEVSRDGSRHVLSYKHFFREMLQVRIEGSTHRNPYAYPARPAVQVSFSDAYATLARPVAAQ